MIVRIATEGQYELRGCEERLRELDDEAVVAAEAHDERRFREAFDRLLELVRSGSRLADDELKPSDLILPPPDASAEEARAAFSGEGLIPG